MVIIIKTMKCFSAHILQVSMSINDSLTLLSLPFMLITKRKERNIGMINLTPVSTPNLCFTFFVENMHNSYYFGFDYIWYFNGSKKLRQKSAFFISFYDFVPHFRWTLFYSNKKIFNPFAFSSLFFIPLIFMLFYQKKLSLFISNPRYRQF